jgi:hypothetical protein
MAKGEELFPDIICRIQMILYFYAPIADSLQPFLLSASSVLSVVKSLLEIDGYLPALGD